MSKDKKEIKIGNKSYTHKHTAFGIDCFVSSDGDLHYRLSDQELENQG